MLTKHVCVQLDRRSSLRCVHFTRGYASWSESHIDREGRKLFPPPLEMFGFIGDLYHIRGDLYDNLPRGALDDENTRWVLPHDLSTFEDWEWVVRHHSRFRSSEPVGCKWLSIVLSHWY